MNESIFSFYFFRDVNLFYFSGLTIIFFIVSCFILDKKYGIKYFQPVHTYFIYAFINIFGMTCFRSGEYIFVSIVIIAFTVFIISITSRDSRFLDSLTKKIPSINPTYNKTLSTVIFFTYLSVNLYLYVKYVGSGEAKGDDFKVGWTEQEKIIGFIYGGIESMFLATIAYDILKSFKMSSFPKHIIALTVVKIATFAFFSAEIFRVKGYFIVLLNIASLCFIAYTKNQESKQRTSTDDSTFAKIARMTSMSIGTFFGVGYVFSFSLVGLFSFIDRFLQSAEATFWAMHYGLTKQILGYQNSFYISSFKVVTHSLSFLGIKKEEHGTILASIVPELPKSEFGGPNTSTFFYYVINDISFIEFILIFAATTIICIKVNALLSQRISNISLTEMIFILPMYNYSGSLASDLSTVTLYMSKQYVLIFSLFFLLKPFLKSDNRIKL